MEFPFQVQKVERCNYLYISTSSFAEGSMNPSTGLGIIVAFPFPFILSFGSGE